MRIGLFFAWTPPEFSVFGEWRTAHGEVSDRDSHLSRPAANLPATAPPCADIDPCKTPLKKAKPETSRKGRQTEYTETFFGLLTEIAASGHPRENPWVRDPEAIAPRRPSPWRGPDPSAAGNVAGAPANPSGRKAMAPEYFRDDNKDLRAAVPRTARKDFDAIQPSAIVRETRPDKTGMFSPESSDVRRQETEDNRYCEESPTAEKAVLSEEIRNEEHTGARFPDPAVRQGDPAPRHEKRSTAAEAAAAWWNTPSGPFPPKRRTPGGTKPPAPPPPGRTTPPHRTEGSAESA